MQRANVWGRAIEMQGSPWTFIVYRREFGGDLLNDIADAYKKDPLELDDLLRFCWAMCRTYSDAVPDFDEWCQGFPEFSMAGEEGSAFASVVDSALTAEVFRPRETGFARWRRKLRARWMGWLQERRRLEAARLLGR